MKKLILFFTVSLAFNTSFSQSVISINDPHIRAQQDRMVYKSWNNFLPEPKSSWWTGGINYNPHYTLTWSYLAPTQNRRYRSGADIRPLSTTGEQTQREASLMLMRQTSLRYKEHSDELGEIALAELYHNTGGAISEVDPLWQLYYKRTLKDVKDYDLSVFINKLNVKQKMYMTETGVIKSFDESMLRLNERLNGAFNTTMERGSRIINYHRIYLEYEKLLNEWQHHTVWAETLLDLRESANKNRKGDDLNAVVWNESDERALMSKIIDEAKKLK